MSFSCQIKAEYLKEMVSAITILADEVKLSIQSDGIRIVAVDPSHIAMADLFMGLSCFRNYETSGMELGVDLDKLKTVLKFVKNDGTIKISYDEEKNILILDEWNITVSIALLDVDSINTPKVSDIEQTSLVVLRKAFIIEGLKLAHKASFIGDTAIYFISPDDGLMIHTYGETDNIKIHVPTDKLDKIECTEPTTSKYSLEFTNSLLKQVTGEMIALSFSNDHPLKLTSTIANGEAKVHYYLASKVAGVPE